MPDEPCGYIGDGCELDGYIAAVPGLHRAVHFKYRPMIHVERLKAATEGERARDDTGAAGVMHKWMKDKITWWDMVDGKVNPLPINQVSVSGLTWKLLSRMFNIISGSDASDQLPSGETPPQFDEGADAKN